MFACRPGQPGFPGGHGGSDLHGGHDGIDHRGRSEAPPAPDSSAEGGDTGSGMTPGFEWSAASACDANWQQQDGDASSVVGAAGGLLPRPHETCDPARLQRSNE